MPSTRKFVFNKNPSISSFYTRRSSDIISTIWEYLGRYKSVAYTESVLGSQISTNASLIHKKSEQIAFTLRQAQDFLFSAKQANLSIKPLLIYYGLVGLAKCLILSGDNQYTLEATPLDYLEHGNHGLSWKAKTAKQISIRDSDNLTDEFCLLHEKGVFPLFRACYSDVAIPKGTEITLKTLLSLIGENWQIYQPYFSEAPNVYGSDAPKNGDAETIGDNKQIIGQFSDYFYLFHKQGTESVEQCIKRLFPELDSLYEPTGRSYRSKQEVNSMDSHIVFSQAKTLQTFALVQPFPSFKLTDFDIYFLLFFILSNLARYRQDKWHKIIQQVAIPDQFFLIEYLFEVVQHKFPLMILRELENKDYNFIGDVATFG